MDAIPKMVYSVLLTIFGILHKFLHYFLCILPFFLRHWECGRYVAIRSPKPPLSLSLKKIGLQEILQSSYCN